MISEKVLPYLKFSFISLILFISIQNAQSVNTFNNPNSKSISIGINNCSKATYSFLKKTFKINQNQNKIVLSSLTKPSTFTQNLLLSFIVVRSTIYSKSGKLWLWFGVIFIFDLTLLIVFLNRKKREKISVKEVTLTSNNIPLKEEKQNSFVEDKQESISAIRLFGNFYFYDSDGDEISKKFSPLLKELFLLVLLNSFEKSNGIRTSNIIDYLWPDMSDKKARNNLAVNIGKIRAILGPDFHEIMVNNSGVWYLDFKKAVTNLNCDYNKYQSVIENTEEYTFQDIRTLITIIQNGGLLVDLSYEWLDAFKAKASNKIIDTLLLFAEENFSTINTDFILKIADTVMLFDMVNENAMQLKCKLLASLGKHSLAHDTYTKFVKEYKLLYDIEYPHSLKSIME